MTTRKKFIRGIGWQSINVLTQVLLQLIFIAVMARQLGTDDFGVMGVALALVGFVEIFSQIGIGPALIQRKELKQGQINGAFFISIILGILFSSLLYFSGPTVAGYYNHPPLGPVLQVIGLSFFISAIAVVPKSMIIKKMEFKKLFLAALIAMSIGNLGIGISMALSGFGVWAYVVALLSQNLIMTVAYWIQNPVRITSFTHWQGTLGMIKYGSGSSLFNIFNYTATKIDTLIVGKFSDLNTVVEGSGSRWSTTGVYDRSIWIMGLPVTVLGKLSDSVMFSGMSMLQNEESKLQRAYLSGSYLISILIVPACAFMIIFAADIVFFFLGYQYIDSIPLVRILFVGVAVRSLIKMSDAVVRALDAVYKASLIKFLFLCLVVGGTFYGLKFGLEGVATTIVISIFIQYFFITRLSVGLLQLPMKSILMKMVPSLIIGLIVGGVSLAAYFLVRHLELNYFLVLLTAGSINLIVLVGLAKIAPWIFGKGNDNVVNMIQTTLKNRRK